MRIAFYGSSLLSAYWNGAATYYRGLLKELAALGHEITFYEPDAFDRQANRDMDPPSWARVVVYPADRASVAAVARNAAAADVVVKASGVGVFDDEILGDVLAGAGPQALKIFLDVDAPATLAELEANPRHLLRLALPDLDAVLTYGGGDPVVAAYSRLGARTCVPVYNALDPETHHPVPPDPAWQADLSFLGNRLPDREARVEEFFFKPARLLPERTFLLGGSGWDPAAIPGNVRYVGHVPTGRHNAFNCTPLAVLNVTREAMAATGFSPATRVFEAAGAGACLISDAWTGLERFLEPDREVLAARDGEEVARHLDGLSPARAADVGAGALARVRRDHTYARRARQVDELLIRLAETAALGRRISA